MAMDALKNLTINIPAWQTRLVDLSGQIDQRQAELAAVAALEGNKSAETRSLRNKGSTESLKPKDDANAHPNEMQHDHPVEDAIPEETPPKRPSTPPPAEIKTPPPISASPPSPEALKQTRDVLMAARARARQQVKKRHRSTSLVSAEGAPAAYRTRSMIIVYYDSYVQGFFDELVRFVSSSRNLMRKAKMAAKVAQIKKLAEMEVPDGDGDDDKMDALPSLRYMSTRRFGPSIVRPGFGPPGSEQPPDVYDNLDKGLEFVQSMCEHGAHQFLRDGDCNDEITKVQKRLVEVLEMAAKEMERVEREEPELAKETGELGKVRTRRPISMRREASAGLKESSPTPTKGDKEDETSSKLEVAEPADLKAGGGDEMDISKPLEVDPNIEADEGIDVDIEIPKLQYRSTRAMRNRGP